MTSEYVIGKFYTVPTVEARYLGRMSIWPVLGPKHEDAEYIKFEHTHYHFDFRFMTTAQYDLVVDHIMSHPKYIRFGMGAIHGQVLIAHSEHYRSQCSANLLNFEPPAAVPRLRKCRRAMPAYTIRPEWLAALSAAYADKALVNGHICPHRGASLAGLPADADGCVTCSLHGLRWDVATGKQAI